MRNKIADELICKYFYGTHYISRAKLKNIPDSFPYKENGTISKSKIEKQLEQYFIDNSVDYDSQHNSLSTGSNVLMKMTKKMLIN